MAVRGPGYLLDSLRAVGHPNQVDEEEQRMWRPRIEGEGGDGRERRFLGLDSDAKRVRITLGSD